MISGKRVFATAASAERFKREHKMYQGYYAILRIIDGPYHWDWNENNIPRQVSRHLDFDWETFEFGPDQWKKPYKFFLTFAGGAEVCLRTTLLGVASSIAIVRPEDRIIVDGKLRDLSCLEKNAKFPGKTEMARDLGSWRFVGSERWREHDVSNFFCEYDDHKKQGWAIAFFGADDVPRVQKNFPELKKEDIHITKLEFYDYLLYNWCRIN